MGYIIVGQDTDGSVTPFDLGIGGMVAKKDCLGKRSLSRSDTLREDRKQLVGLKTVDPRVHLTEGAQIVASPATQGITPMLGHVGQCAQTHFFKAGVTLCRDAHERFQLIVRRSFAEYCCLMLLDAAQPYLAPRTH